MYISFQARPPYHIINSPSKLVSFYCEFEYFFRYYHRHMECFVGDVYKLQGRGIEACSHRKKTTECVSAQSFFFWKHRLKCNLHSQLCTPFSSSRLEYVTTRCWCRAYEKTVCCCSLSFLWLICSFWHINWIYVLAHTVHYQRTLINYLSRYTLNVRRPTSHIQLKLLWKGTSLTNVIYTTLHRLCTVLILQTLI